MNLRLKRTLLFTFVDGRSVRSALGQGAHKCSGTTPIELKCAHGSNHNPINTDDSCR